jgi:hypothetical protein
MSSFINAKTCLSASYGCSVLKAHVESDRWKALYTARRQVIACATVIEEMQGWLPADVSSEVLDFGLHLHQEKLLEVLQTKIDQASSNAEVLLLEYGLCSLAVVGLQARTAHLVIPRVVQATGDYHMLGYYSNQPPYIAQ